MTQLPWQIWQPHWRLLQQQRLIGHKHVCIYVCVCTCVCRCVTMHRAEAVRGEAELDQQHLPKRRHHKPPLWVFLNSSWIHITSSPVTVITVHQQNTISSQALPLLTRGCRNAATSACLWPPFASFPAWWRFRPESFSFMSLCSFSAVLHNSVSLMSAREDKKQKSIS